MTVDYLIKLRTQVFQKAVEDLSIRLEQQEKRVQALKHKVEAFRLKHDIPEESHWPKEDALRKKLEEANVQKLKGEEVNITEIEEELIGLSKLRVEYNSMLRDLYVEESFYGALNKRLEDEKRRMEQPLQPRAIIIERASL